MDMILDAHGFANFWSVGLKSTLKFALSINKLYKMAAFRAYFIMYDVLVPKIIYTRELSSCTA